MCAVVPGYVWTASGIVSESMPLSNFSSPRACVMISRESTLFVVRSDC